MQASHNPDSSGHVTSAVDQIAEAIDIAYGLLTSRWTDAAGGQELSDHEAKARAAIEGALEAYTAQLAILHRSLKGSLKAHLSCLSKSVLDTIRARIAGLVRGYAKAVKVPSPREVLAKAKTFSIWVPLPETVRVIWLD